MRPVRPPPVLIIITSKLYQNSKILRSQCVPVYFWDNYSIFKYSSFYEELSLLFKRNDLSHFLREKKTTLNSEDEPGFLKFNKRKIWQNFLKLEVGFALNICQNLNKFSKNLVLMGFCIGLPTVCCFNELFFICEEKLVVLYSENAIMYMFLYEEM